MCLCVCVSVVVHEDGRLGTGASDNIFLPREFFFFFFQPSRPAQGAKFQITNCLGYKQDLISLP